MRWPCGLLACLVVLVRRGCGAACGVNCRALLNPARQLAMLGRTGGRVWGSARALSQPGILPDDTITIGLTRVVGHGG